MAKVIMTKRDNCGDYQEEITCKIVGKEEFARKMCEKFLEEMGSENSTVITGTTVKVGDMPDDKELSGLKNEVVAIYDNEGIPSFMYRIMKKKIPNFSLAGVIKPIRHLLLAEKSTMKYLFPCTRTVKSTGNHIAFRCRSRGQISRMMRRRKHVSQRARDGIL